MVSEEILWAIIGGLALLLFRDVLLEGAKKLFNSQSLTLTEVSALKAEVNALKEKQAEQDGLLVAVTELKAEMRSLREAVSHQPNMIAGVVSETIRATLQFVRMPKQANA